MIAKFAVWVIDGSASARAARVYQDGEYGTKLHVDALTIVHGALDLAATAVMIPMKRVYMLEIDTELNHDVMANILASNHGRIPVCEDHKPIMYVGLLLVRLIVLDPDDARPTAARPRVPRPASLVATTADMASMDGIQ